MIKGDIFKFKFNHEYTVAEAIEEVKTNIFLRCDDNVVKQSLNLKDATDQEIFSKLRDLKDAF